MGSKLNTLGGVFDDILKFCAENKTVFGPRRLDRIRVLFPCFRPSGPLGTSGGKASSQDYPKRIPQLDFDDLVYGHDNLSEICEKHPETRNGLAKFLYEIILRRELIIYLSYVHKT